MFNYCQLIDCMIGILIQVSWYVAEFWNTITNLSMIITPLYGLQQVFTERLEKRYLYMLRLWIIHWIQVYLVIHAVAVSWYWLHNVPHDTSVNRHLSSCHCLTGVCRRYSMQMMDEIPMVWSSGAFIYTIYMVSTPFR